MKQLRHFFAALFFCCLAVAAQAQCQAGFTVSISGGTATFTNTSTGLTGIPTYYWDFGDGNYAWTTNASNQYMSNGTYYVCLYAADSLNWNCNSMFCDTIVISNSPCNGLAASAGVTNASTCNACDGAINLNITGGTAPYTYAWSHGPTTQNLSNLCIGNYWVTVTDANGCITTANAYVGCTPNNNCQAGFTFTVNGGTVVFTNTSTGGNWPFWYWDFGDGSPYSYVTSPSHTYTNTGVYSVCLAMYDSIGNCTSSYCDTIVITNTPCNGFGVTSSVTHASSCNSCDGAISLTVSGGTPPYAYNWVTGSTQQNISGLCPATYSVNVTDANGCMAQNYAAVTCTSSCQASFTYTISNGTVNFTNTSTGGMPTYFWDFGDGNYAYTANTTHTFANGIYHVCLMLTDSFNLCASTFCDTVVITNSPCNLSATVTTTDESVCGACDGSASVTVSGGTAPYTYNWSNFGTMQNLSSLCQGWYNVMVTDSNGCTAYGFGNVNCPPNPNCTANFTYTVNNNTVTFTNTSQNQSSNLDFFWDFGDGNYYTGNTPPPHNYSSSGFYWACLHMWDSLSNCYNVYCDTVIIGNNMNCYTTFYMYQDSVNTLLWYAAPVIYGTGPFTYLWDFGDGNQSTQATPTHVYAQPGQYTICLTTVDANGCTSTWCDSTSVQRILQNSVASNQMQFLNVLPTGISDPAPSISKVWPNPANEYIDVQLDREVDANVRIVDLLGNTVYEGRLEGSSTRIGLENIAAGYYNLVIEDGGSRMHKKIAVIR